MALTSYPNPISASGIRTEFGATSGTSVRFGDYRAVNQTVGTLTGLPLDTGVPQSGPIKFSDFYSKRLNVVVDLYSGSAETRVNARTKYDAGNVTIIGGFKTAEQKPAAGAGSRIIANVNKLIGSEKTGRNYAALKTGQWGTDATMEIVIGSSGGIYGAGGNGGRGGDGNGSDGGQGTTALAIQYPVAINNQGGTIAAGRGGGGGGAGGRGYKHADTQRGCQGRQDCIFVAGGGGGGGRGFPAGDGGASGNNPGSCRGAYSNPQGGGGGNTGGSGGGGAGGGAGQGNCISAATGGAGGGEESSGGTGSSVPSGGYGVGSGGDRGYAVIIDSAGSLISYVGNGPDGDTVNGASA